MATQLHKTIAILSPTKELRRPIIEAALKHGPKTGRELESYLKLSKTQVFQTLTGMRKECLVHIGLYRKAIVITRGSESVRWHPVYVFGPGEDAPMPIESKSGKSAHQVAKRKAKYLQAVSQVRSPDAMPVMALPMDFFRRAA